MKLAVFVLMFLILGSLIIINNNDLNIYGEEGSKEFVRIFSGWVDGIYENVKTMTGNFVKLDWVPE